MWIQTSVTFLFLPWFSRNFHLNEDWNYKPLFLEVLLLNFQIEKGRYSAPNWHRKTPAVTSPCKCHGWPRRLHNDLCARPLRFYWLVGDLNARLWRPYSNPTVLFQRGVARCLFWACSKCVPSVGILCNPTASTGITTALLRRCLQSYCAHLRDLHSSWPPWDRRETAALVW